MPIDYKISPKVLHLVVADLTIHYDRVVAEFTAHHDRQAENIYTFICRLHDLALLIHYACGGAARDAALVRPITFEALGQRLLGLLYLELAQGIDLFHAPYTVPVRPGPLLLQYVEHAIIATQAVMVRSSPQ